ncbi:MAG: acyl-ACP--UDP-N-acetylglucosamine O-acyltransferase [Gammaproteobacteria bacterium]|nr:acyl-ACP--UDP-N-acetylglucosamine O-acyltransferase [Gammaproteobacteria bacterium]MCF6260021.1 acyl-ACP--UDP-N-acetylglucosamine O-acyltransferase [Gammaproteobacteria bacterium]
MIHSQAIIDPDAHLAKDVSVGPFSVIGAGVEIGEGTVIDSHVVINGPTRIGRDNKIYSFAAIGGDPQDKKYAGEATELEIGDRNVIREYCTISRGTTQDVGITRIGNDNWIMATVHIAHDCQIGNHTIFANSTTLAGHVIIEDYVILGGFTLVHQFCKVGTHCFTGMNSVISKDVLPFLMVSGHMAKPHGLNTEGLKRRGFSSDALSQLRKAYKIIYRSGNTLTQAVSQLEPMAENCDEVAQLLMFIKASTRGIVR